MINRLEVSYGYQRSNRKQNKVTMQRTRDSPNAISNISAVPQATVKSFLNGESKNPGAVTLKKLCDGFEITLGEFFSTPEFDELEQEIK